MPESVYSNVAVRVLSFLTIPHMVLITYIQRRIQRRLNPGLRYISAKPKHTFDRKRSVQRSVTFDCASGGRAFDTIAFDDHSVTLHSANNNTQSKTNPTETECRLKGGVSKAK
jgi:hypothetical protein